MRKLHLKLLVVSSFLLLSQQANAALSILLYHQVSDSKRYAISEDKFKEQMDYLLANKFTFLNPKQLNDSFLKQTNFSDKDYVAITFDDGWKTQMKAVKYMAEKNIPAIFFINGEPIDKKWGGYLTKDQLKEIEGNPLFLFADHSYTHEVKILHNPEKLPEDFNKNVAFLKANTKQPSFVYAYPYGAKKAAYIDYLKSQNVPLVYGVAGKKVKNSADVSKYDIPRYTVTNQTSFETFKKYVK